MFAVHWMPEARTCYDRLKSDAERARAGRRPKGKGKKSPQDGLFLEVAKAIRLLCQNPRHPSLHTHEFTSLPHPYRQGDKVFEAYAQNDTPAAYRVFWCYGPDRGDVTIISIGPHP